MKITITVTGIKFLGGIAYEEASAAFGKVVQKRGYIVIGQPPGANLYEIGEHIHQVYQYRTKTAFVVVSRTTRRDIEQQTRMLAKDNPDWHRTDNPGAYVGATFFRIVPLAMVRQQKLAAKPKLLKAPPKRLKGKVA